VSIGTNATILMHGLEHVLFVTLEPKLTNSKAITIDDLLVLALLPEPIVNNMSRFGLEVLVSNIHSLHSQ
jgi:hypothetical protein